MVDIFEQALSAFENKTFLYIVNEVPHYTEFNSFSLSD